MVVFMTGSGILQLEGGSLSSNARGYQKAAVNHSRAMYKSGGSCYDGYVADGRAMCPACAAVQLFLRGPLQMFRHLKYFLAFSNILVLGILYIGNFNLACWPHD